MDNQNTRQRPPGYELFLAPLLTILDPKDQERIQFAYFASKYGHAKQIRDDGSRYFDHPKATAWIYFSELGGKDPRVIITCLLHDLSEDSYLLSPYRICLNFGQEIALDVLALTKLPKGKETTEEYLNRVIKQGPWTIVTKLCDRLHNLRSLNACSLDKKNRQIAETKSYHSRLLIPALLTYDEPWVTHANALKEKIADIIAMHEQSR